MSGTERQAPYRGDGRSKLPIVARSAAGGSKSAHDHNFDPLWGDYAQLLRVDGRPRDAQEIEKCGQTIGGAELLP
jgi:hypothetical protein